MNKKISMKNKLIISALLIVIIVVGGWFALTNDGQEQLLIADDYKNTIYTIEGRRIELTDGVSEIEAAPGSAEKITTRFFGNEVIADLNGDEIPDIAFLLTQTSGGTGTFYYIVAALQTDGGGYAGTNGILLGDRIAPQTTEFRDGRIIVNYADRKPGEPFATVPSVGKSAYFILLEDGTLAVEPVVLESPKPGARISSPLTVTGVAIGPWFFEASFPVELRDEQGNVIAQHFVTAQTDWMTTDYVRFSGTLIFTKPAQGTAGKLILKKDNPSGLPEHDDSREIEVRF
jgi:hypothetical protein